MCLIQSHLNGKVNSYSCLETQLKGHLLQEAFLTDLSQAKWSVALLCSCSHPLGCRSVAQSCPTLCDPIDCSMQASLSITNSWSLLKCMSIKLMMPSNHLILYCPLLLPSIFPSIRVISNESGLHVRWPKYQNFSFRISPSSEYSGFISFRIDWFDLLAVQATF